MVDICYRSDFVYMVPPFMAYYAASSNNQTLFDLTMKQCEEYRALLKSSSGAWMHISASSGADTALWSTGNGWAAMGMTRVLATLLKSSFSSSIQQTNSANLIAWIKEIIDGAKATSVRHLLSDMYLH
jgi:rhamnogalacturonyl hydrolase YesR